MLFGALLIGGPSAYEHSEGGRPRRVGGRGEIAQVALLAHRDRGLALRAHALARALTRHLLLGEGRDRKSTRLNSSHVSISYAVFCLKKKTASLSCTSH